MRFISVLCTLERNADVYMSLPSAICLSPFYHPELGLKPGITEPLTSLTPVTAHKHTHSHDSHLHKHKHPHANAEGELSSMTRVQRLAMFLEAHFGEVEFHQPDEEGSDSEEREAGERSDEEPSLLVRLDEADARIDLISLVSWKINRNTAFWSVFVGSSLFFQLFGCLTDRSLLCSFVCAIYLLVGGVGNVR